MSESKSVRKQLLLLLPPPPPLMVAVAEVAKEGEEDVLHGEEGSLSREAAAAGAIREASHSRLQVQGGGACKRIRDGFKEGAAVMEDVVGRTDEVGGEGQEKQRMWTPLRMDGQKGFSGAHESLYERWRWVDLAPL